MKNIDKKKPLVIGPIAFFAAAFLGLPFWLTCLLPFTVIAVTVNLLWVVIRAPSTSTPPSDETYETEENITQVTPMNSRKYDLIGASSLPKERTRCPTLSR